ncbi:hypothetical protein N7522_013690 [Penicillium canescens]|nr:hypothetical protein N7522_013690 [Penicillium canescens]
MPIVVFDHLETSRRRPESHDFVDGDEELNRKLAVASTNNALEPIRNDKLGPEWQSAAVRTPNVFWEGGFATPGSREWALAGYSPCRFFQNLANEDRMSLWAIMQINEQIVNILP